MKAETAKSVRCAIYTRVSTDAGLDQDFNSLDAQRDSSEAYIRSQAHASWSLIKGQYNDGGFSVARLTGRHCKSYWPISGPKKWMSSSSTKLID
jgi:hypothetical protein